MHGSSSRARVHDIRHSINSGSSGGGSSGSLASLHSSPSQSLRHPAPPPIPHLAHLPHSHHHPLSIPSSASASTATLSSSYIPVPPVPLHSMSSHHSLLRSSSSAGTQQAGLTSTSSLLHQLGSSASSTTTKPTSHSYRSLHLSHSIRLAEAIESSRIADRLLRTSVSSSTERSTAESQVDDSITKLAETVLEVMKESWLHGQQTQAQGGAGGGSGGMPAALHQQVMLLLEQLIWSDEKRVTGGSNLNIASTKSLHSNSSHLTSSRLTHYELNLLHSRSDSSFHTEIQSHTEREQEMQQRIDILEKENQEMKSDITTFVADAQQAQQKHHELTRFISSLEGRLTIQQEEYDHLSSKLLQLQSFSREQSELILQSRQEIVQVRETYQQAKETWSENEGYEVLQAKLVEAELQQQKSDAQIISVNKLYYTIMQQYQKQSQKKEQIQSELNESRREISKLQEQYHTLLRPYTPRPEWRRLYKERGCEELYPTLLASTMTGIEVVKDGKDGAGEGEEKEKEKDEKHSSTSITSLHLPRTLDHITQLFQYLQLKQDEIVSLHQTIATIQEAQVQMKRDLAKSKREVEFAQRNGGGGGGGGLNSNNGNNNANIMNNEPSNSVSQSASQAQLRTSSSLSLHNGAITNAASSSTSNNTNIPIIYIPPVWLKPKSTSRYFLALGASPQIPSFLRCTGKIRNRHLSKKDTEAVVREIWIRKIAHDKERGRLDMNLSDFVFFFLKNKYGLSSLVNEWGYNLLDALERYRWDADCELFLKILVGDISEEVYYDQALMMSTLIAVFIQLEAQRMERKGGGVVGTAVVGGSTAASTPSSSSSGITPSTPSGSSSGPFSASTSTLPLEHIIRTLRLLFPAKPEEAFDSIITSLQQCFLDAPKCQYDYGLLFRENRTMNETSFVEEIRDQHLYEIENFMILLQEEIQALERVDENELMSNGGGAMIHPFFAQGGGHSYNTGNVGAGGNTLNTNTLLNPTQPSGGYVRLYQIQSAWLRLDPHLSTEYMERCINKALRIAPIGSSHGSTPTYPTLDTTLCVPPQEFCAHLFTQNLIKYSMNYDISACVKVVSVGASGGNGGERSGGGGENTSARDTPTLSSSPSSASTSAAAVASDDKDNTSTSTKGKKSRRSTLAGASEMLKTVAESNNGGGKSGDNNYANKPPTPTSKSLTSDSSIKKLTSSSSNLTLSSPSTPSLLSLLTSPKLLRLRHKFGLDARNLDESFANAVLERGPGYVDQYLMTNGGQTSNAAGGAAGAMQQQQSNLSLAISSHSLLRSNGEREVESLLNEKQVLDEVRLLEKAKAKEQAERSQALILGNGIAARRGKDTVASNTNISNEEKSSISPIRTPAPIRPLVMPLAQGHIIATTVVTTTNTNGTSVSFEPINTATGSGSGHGSGMASPSSSSRSSLVINKRNSSSGAVTSSSSSPRYKSSFFSPPSTVPAERTIYEPQNSPTSTNVSEAFKRRYTMRRRSQTESVDENGSGGGGENSVITMTSIP